METHERITGSVRALAAFSRDTQHDLAGVLGISQTSVAHKLGGKIQWSVRDLEKLSAHYSVTIDQLTAGPRAWLGHAGRGAHGADGVNAGYPGMGSADGIQSAEHYRLDALVAA